MSSTMFGSLYKLYSSLFHLGRWVGPYIYRDFNFINILSTYQYWSYTKQSYIISMYNLISSRMPFLITFYRGHPVVSTELKMTGQPSKQQSHQDTQSIRLKTLKYLINPKEQSDSNFVQLWQRKSYQIYSHLSCLVLFSVRHRVFGEQLVLMTTARWKHQQQAYFVGEG